MQNFMAYYWLRQADRSVTPLCECIEAESVEAAEAIVAERLEKKVFSFESQNRGRVILQSQHVQYVEIEQNACPTEPY